MIREDLQEYVVFKVGKESFALNATHVKRIEMNKKEALRKLPNLPPEYPGVITDVEDLVTLFDLRRKFNMYTTDLEEIPYVIVVKIEEMNITVGFVVDKVDDIKLIPHDAELGSINESISGNSLDFIKGIYRPNKNTKNNENNKDNNQNNEQEVMYSVLNLEKLIQRSQLNGNTNSSEKKVD